jgi:acetolactate synthase-1/2/3 large subunit
MVLVGAGCNGDDVDKMLNKYLADTKIPVVTSLMGRGIIDETYSNYVGMIGSYGNRCANMAVAKADLLITLGSRMDTRQTGAMYQDFLKGKIIHVDLDENELDYHRLGNRLKVHASIVDFLKALDKESVTYQDYSTWNGWIAKLKENYSQDKEIERFVDNKAPYQLLQRLNEISKEGDVFTADVGQNQMWSAQTLKLKKGQRFVNSGGLAPMGFAMPVAIGIAFANPKKTIYCVTGDGGFHMAIQSMLTIAQYNLNIKVIVINNAALGMITQFQHLYFNDRMYGTTKAGGFINPDFETMAKAYGIQYSEYTSDSLYEFEAVDGPGMINYVVSGLTTVSPKLEYNKPIDKPSPQLPDDEYQKVMENL